MKTRVVVAAIVALAMSASSAFAQVLLTGTASNSVSGGGPLAGAQVGYNWQLGSFVTGVESDLSGGPQSAMNTTLPIAATTTAVTNTNMNWFGTVRGRLGWAIGPVLLYGTGGLAYGNVDITIQMNISGVLSLASETSPVRAGWVAGGSIDYMVLPNLEFRLSAR